MADTKESVEKVILMLVLLTISLIYTLYENLNKKVSVARKVQSPNMRLFKRYFKHCAISTPFLIIYFLELYI